MAIETLDINETNYVNEIKKMFLPYLNEEKISYLDSLVINDLKPEDIQTIFKNLINPNISSKCPEELNRFIINGLIDMYTLDFFSKLGVYPEYYSNNPDAVIFIREKLSSLGDIENQIILSFKGSIDQIIQNTSSSYDEFVSDYEKCKNHETEYDMLIQKVGGLMPNLKHQEDYIASIMKLSAKKGKVAALDIIKQALTELNPYDIDNCTPEEIQEFVSRTLTEIDNYLNKNQTISYS